MAVKMKNPPVFLMNEADQVVHDRKTDAKNTDYTENAMQNIKLEAMENFPGILILTTNMKEIIDEAYYRRFNLKLEFKKLDADGRRELWKLHLHKGIPGVDEIDIELLANNYSFTGGQIALVIQNACSEAITRGSRYRRLTIEDLIKYSDLEHPYQPYSMGSKVGFSSTVKNVS